MEKYTGLWKQNWLYWHNINNLNTLSYLGRKDRFISIYLQIPEIPQDREKLAALWKYGIKNGDCKQLEKCSLHRTVVIFFPFISLPLYMFILVKHWSLQCDVLKLMVLNLFGLNVLKQNRGCSENVDSHPIRRWSWFLMVIF